MGGIYKNGLPLINLSSQPKGTKQGKRPSKRAQFLRFPPLIPLSFPLSGAAAFMARELKRDQAGRLSYRDDVTFDPKGPGSGINLLRHLEHYSTADRIKEEAFARAAEVYNVKNVGEGKANAFLHAYLSYRLTKALGPTIARRFTDANEVKPVGNYRRFQLTGGEPNPEKEMKADLFNNGFGRRLYVEGLAKNDQEAIKMIKEAIERGNLSVINKP